MIWICAWCQQEGKLGVQKLPSEKNPEQQSHGICQNHALHLRHTYRPSLLRQPCTTSSQGYKRSSNLKIPMSLLSSLHSFTCYSRRISSYLSLQ